MSHFRKHLSPATVLAGIAVFFAMAGGAYAVGKNSVGSKQLKKNAVTAAKIKKNAVTTAKIMNGAVTGKKIKLSTLGAVPRVAGHSTFPQTRIVATDGANENDAREASPEVPMFTVGPVTIYAKCYTDTSDPRTYADLYIKTSENGVIFQSDEDELVGDPFLNTGTAETDRELMYVSTGANSSNAYMMHSDETVAMTPEGRAFEARHSLAVKNGDLPGGNGVYGEGNVCLVAGDVTEYR